MSSTECQHRWITNGGRGGEPIFVTSHFSGERVSPLVCHLCRSRTFITEEQFRMAQRSQETRQQRRARERAQQKQARRV